MNNVIRIDKYEARVNKQGTVDYFAIKGKNTYKMPECHKAMYTDDYLAIREMPTDEYMTNLYGLIPGEPYYIPIRTA